MDRDKVKYLIVAETRDKHKSTLKDKLYNDYVSMDSIKEFNQTCKDLGYSIEYLGGTEDLIQRFSGNNKDSIHKDNENTIYINYNYGTPSDFKRGQSPMFMEMNNLKYSGSDPFVSLLVNDKESSKLILEHSNIAELYIPKGIQINKDSELENINWGLLDFPVVVKPNSEGSSLGITDNSICRSETEIIQQVNTLIQKYNSILVEEYIEGYELTVWIIGNPNEYRLVKPLLISVKEQYYFEKKVMTMEDKANHSRKYHNPCNYFSSNTVKNLIEISKTIFANLGLRDYGRIDFRINKGKIYFIEANALPAFSKSSEIGEITRLYNISYSDICQHLISTITDRLMGKTN